MTKILHFTGPRAVEVKSEPLSKPGPGQVLVESECSAISAGTEMLVYRDQFPRELAVDQSITALAGDFRYPMRYGYAAVGRVTTAGAGAAGWIGQRVFAFQPHSSHFTCAADGLIPVPDDIPAEAAAFLPNMETAVNFLMDGAPLIGEDVCVFGQGVVGLLTTALLKRFPLAQLVTLETYPLRRAASQAAGASLCLNPANPEDLANLAQMLPGGADLVFELSGSPAALDLAIQAAGFAGRVVIGSWYGQKRASLDLGGKFHRSRIQLISSQVSTIAPALSGRWDKQRRFDLAWEMIRQVKPERWITQRFGIEDAELAYQLLDQQPEETIQVIFKYSGY